MIRSFLPRLFTLAAILPGLASSETLDTLVFGNDASEAAQATNAEHSDRMPGGLGEPARHLLPGGASAWQGGTLKFILRVDPERQNYFTIRLWGDDVNHNQMTQHVEGKQVGCRHLGDIEALEIGSEAPAYPGRFLYRTCPLPLDITKGKQTLHCEIHATGPIWGYGTSFDKYQKPMTDPTRGIYRVYTHTDGCFVPPAGEKQGEAPKTGAVRTAPGPEVLDELKTRVNGQIDGLLKDAKRPASQMQTLFLAKAYHVKWSHAAGNPETLAKIQLSLDSLYRAYIANPHLAEAEPSTYNPDWFGLGPCGGVLDLLAAELKPGLDQFIDNGKGGRIRRRDAFRDMLVACRDWHREHRRQYTNQTMINDLYGIYLANRGIAVVAPSKALPEKRALQYLYESVGLQPWLGSEKDGKPTRPLGDSYYQLTKKGLTKELGFVGNYGEVLDWVTLIYEATRPAAGTPGDPAIKEQLIKIARARAPFRYPMLDLEGHPAMVQETIVGWRDTHYPGDVAYAQRPTWDGSPLEAAAATLDPDLVGYARQMFADNQFFATIAKRMEDKVFRVTFGLLAVPAEFTSAHAGEKLPVAKIPDGVPFKPGNESVYAGRGDFYKLQYEPYLVAMNMSADKNFELNVPAHAGPIRNLVTAKAVAPGSVAKVGPRSKVVLYFN